MERPSFIGHYSQFIEEDNARYPDSPELLSIGSAVGRRLGLVRIGVHIETVPPGRRTSYPHAESEEEEFAFVIEGHPDAWIDGHLYPLGPGDFVAFPAGTGIAHTFINNTAGIVRLLVGGEAYKEKNKIFYPLNDEENLNKKLQGRFWESAPRHDLGPHNGRPSVSSGGWGVPVLDTDRLRLRAFEKTDAASVYNYAHNPKVAQWVTWEPHRNPEESLKFIEFAQGLYLKGSYLDPMAITLKSDPDHPIGACGAFWISRAQKIMELGACLGEPHWGKGYVVEALRAVIEEVFKTQDVHRIQSRCKLGNVQSRRMMEKLGMQYEGLQRSGLYCKGRSWDMEVFSLVR